jgi:hypothetical protein
MKIEEIKSAINNKLEVFNELKINTANRLESFNNVILTFKHEINDNIS